METLNCAGKPRRQSRCELHRELVLKMAAEGAYLNEIGRAVGTTGIRVRQFLKRNGADRHFPTTQKGPKCHRWKGGVVVNKDGYREIMSRGHPHAKKHTHYMLEHRLVMEKMIGRYLLPNEVVHHKDGNKLNNSPENLQLFSENAEHLRHELTGRVPKWSPEGYANMCKGRLHKRDRAPDGTLLRLKRDDSQCIQNTPQ